MSRTIQFNDLSVSNLPITNWLWNFGDENTSTEQNPEHTYSADGVFLVTLTVTAGGVQAYTSKYVVAAETIDLRNFWVVGKAGLSSPYTSSGNYYSLYYDETDGGWGSGLAHGFAFTESGYGEPMDGVSDPNYPSDKIVITHKGIWRVNPYLGSASLLKSYYSLFSRTFYYGPPVAGISQYERVRVYESPEYPNFFIVSVGFAQIAYTFDGGETWTPSFIFSGSDSYLDTLQLAVSRSNTQEGTGRIYAFLNRQGQLYRSDDWGVTWELVWLGSADGKFGNYFQIQYPEGFVLPESRDNGTPNTNTTDQILYCISKFDGEGGDDAILYRSDDAGDSFQEVYNFGRGAGEPRNLICHPSSALLLYAIRADNKLMWSNDGGLNWTVSSSAIPNSAQRLQVDPVDVDRLTAWEYKTQSNTSTYKKSYTEDRGETWTSINLGSNDSASAFGMEIY